MYIQFKFKSSGGMSEEEEHHQNDGRRRADHQWLRSRAEWAALAAIDPADRRHWWSDRLRPSFWWCSDSDWRFPDDVRLRGTIICAHLQCSIAAKDEIVLIFEMWCFMKHNVAKCVCIKLAKNPLFFPAFLKTTFPMYPSAGRDL